MTTQILITGFGGQGILFSGKFLAYKAMMEGSQVSWLPSYGPEMRGGTASCSVIVSDSAVGSPIVTRPDVLIAMNLPSLDRYESAVVPGGIIIADSTLIERGVNRADVRAFRIPATQMAADEGITTLANMIIVGKLIRECDAISYDNLDEALAKVVSARHKEMLDLNRRAIDVGYQYEG
jgi:2-oxoglutarate ferredoxin oxidoreductase subunit gamma